MGIEPGMAGQSTAPTTGFPRLGAFASEDTTSFVVWAPDAQSVSLALSNGESVRLERGDHGVWAGLAPARPGDEYGFSINGGEPLPDPCSRWQPEGLLGRSRVLNSSRRVARRPFTAPALAELVIYELHVGTFSADGTFDAVIPWLDELRELGITAVELMPVATFPGERGWGYDSVYTFATHQAYGGPEGLARLIEAAHAAGLAIILDVVYNHLGAGSDRITAFGPYLTDRHATVWGEAIDYGRKAVREWAIQNAEMWVRDFGVDGLRLDATHAIFDDSQPHVLRELRDRVKQINRHALVISEMEIGDQRPLEQWGHDAQWADALHHSVHVLLTGEREGYYQHYGRLSDVARELTRPERPRFVVCAQNHDQVGNRAVGDRLHGRDLRLAAFIAILSAGTPLLFQGEEYDEPHPFQYFTDHTDPEIARLTREGRRREFAEFSGFRAQQIPDPQDERTFLRSKLDRAAGDSDQLDYYRELLALRRALGDAATEIVRCDEQRRLLRYRRGRLELVVNFSDVEQEGVPARTAMVLW
jgi:maltooligosyltrehalose trehalohydrolase